LNSLETKVKINKKTASKPIKLKDFGTSSSFEGKIICMSIRGQPKAAFL
jgi:hypothetical protein